jgi:hypothetical protein
MSHDTQPPDASGRRAQVERLTAAEGAAVYDARGKRLGMFIEPVEGGSEVAIRHDGVFVWRRRVLPASMVAAVRPEHGTPGAVVLNVDEKTLDDWITQTTRGLDHADETRTPAEDHLPSADEGGVLDDELTSRLAVYVAARDKPDEDVRPSALSDGFAERYLLFIPTPRGYQIVEQDGRVPAILDDVSLPGDETGFCVIKVGRSPLPRDGRPCAYLERW